MNFNLKKSLLIIFCIFSQALFAASDAVYTWPMLVEVADQMNIKNITDLASRNKFTQKLEEFLVHYEGDDENLNLWKNLSLQINDLAVDALDDYVDSQNPYLKKFITGRQSWADTCLKMLLLKVNSDQDIFAFHDYINVLTKANASINFQEPYSVEPLAKSMFFNKLIAINYCFINSKAFKRTNLINSGRTLSLLQFAIKNDSVSIVKKCLNAGLINCNSIINLDQDSILMFAVRHNAINVVKFLLDNYYTDMNSHNYDRLIDDYMSSYVDNYSLAFNFKEICPLGIALYNDNLDIIELLLTKGAKLYQLVYNDNNIIVNRTRRIIFWAIQYDCQSLVSALLQKKDIYLLDSDIKQVVKYAFANNNQDIIKILLDNLDINQYYPDIFVDAFNQGKLELVKMLLQYRDRIKFNDKNVYNSLFFSIRNHDFDLFTLLSENTNCLDDLDFARRCLGIASHELLKLQDSTDYKATENLLKIRDLLISYLSDTVVAPEKNGYCAIL